MKKILILILSLVLMASLSTVTFAAEENVKIVAVKGTPVIGDTVDPIWDTVQFCDTEVDNLYYGEGLGEQTAKVKAMYDDNYLYFLAEVTGEINEFSIFLRESDGNLIWILLDPDGQLYGVDTAKLDPRFAPMSERSTKYSVIMTDTGYIFQIGVDTRVDEIRYTDSFDVEFQMASYGANPVGTFGWTVEDMYLEVAAGYPMVFGTLEIVPSDDPYMPDTDAPDTEEPDTEEPDTEEPDTDAPDTEEPDTDAPDTEEPDTDAPDTEAPDTSAPVVTDDATNDEDNNNLLPIILAAVAAAVVVAVVVVLIIKKKKK